MTEAYKKAPFVIEDAAVRVLDETDEHVLLAMDRLELYPGEWLHVIGPNGSGKSTLVKLAAGVPEAIAGGRAEARATVRRGFAGEEPIPFVMQDPEAGIIGATPREDLALALEARGIGGSAAAERLERLLHETGLWPVRDLPVEALSGGQKQLLAAAGCAAAGTPLLLFDEAAAMLDAASRAVLLQGVRKLHRSGAAVIWISHAPEEIRHGDRVIGLNGGRIVYDGGADMFFEPIGHEAKGISPCERLGYDLPHTVRTALALRRFGIRLEPLPLTPAALAEAVNAW